MNKRINVILPDETLRLVDRIAGKGSRSRLIDLAVCQYLEHKNRQNLRMLLEQGAKNRAARDLELAQDWFAIDEQAWPKRK